MRHSAPREAMTLSAAQRACKDRILTQPHPARIGNTVDAVVLKHGRLFMLADDTGDVPWRRPHGYGLFDGDTRVLDGFVLELDGQAPTLLSVTDTRGFEARHDLTNPELPQRGGGVLPSSTIAIRRERLIRGDVVNELLSVRNYGAGPARLTVSLDFRARFEDIFVIKRFVRGPRGRVRRPRLRGNAVELAYDARSASASLPASSASSTASPGAPARRPRACGAGSSGSTSSGSRARPRCARRIRSSTASCCARSSTCACCARACTGATSSARVCRGSRRCSAATRPPSPSRRCPSARPRRAHAAPLARYQATAIDAYRDAEPGKILHELRTGELARLEIGRAHVLTPVTCQSRMPSSA